MEEAVKAAVAALNKLLSAERCAQLVEAIIRKFVALTPEEIQEWQVRLGCCCLCVCSLAALCAMCLGKRWRLPQHSTLVHRQDDPEGYVLSTDVESSPDADTPRPCGLALLLCMLERGPDTVAHALIALAAQLQVACLCVVVLTRRMQVTLRQPSLTAPARSHDRLSRW